MLGKPSSKLTWEATHGKPDVTSIGCAAGITAGKIQRSLRMQQAAILHFIWRPTQTLWPLTFWSQNKWVHKNHRATFVCQVRWSELDQFLRSVLEKQTKSDEDPTHSNAVSVVTVPVIVACRVRCPLTSVTLMSRHYLKSSRNNKNWSVTLISLEFLFSGEQMTYLWVHYCFVVKGENVFYSCTSLFLNLV